MCVLAVILFNIVVIGLLRRARSRVDIELLATRKSVSSSAPPAPPVIAINGFTYSGARFAGVTGPYGSGPDKPDIEHSTAND
ncbi:hypothetical protein ACVXHA_09520 [Escherichia coli]